VQSVSGADSALVVLARSCEATIKCTMLAHREYEGMVGAAQNAPAHRSGVQLCRCTRGEQMFRALN
jgi:hypothetical protein